MDCHGGGWSSVPSCSRVLQCHQHCPGARERLLLVQVSSQQRNCSIRFLYPQWWFLLSSWLEKKISNHFDILLLSSIGLQSAISRIIIQPKKESLPLCRDYFFLQPVIMATHKPGLLHALSRTPHAMCVHLSGGKHPPLPRYWERLPWVSGTPYIPSEKSTFPTHYHKFTNDIFIKNRVIISRICV